jgi:hypothetical protein
LKTDDSGGPNLTLTRRAAIAQSTGEDWSDVGLTVSTARVARAVDVANLPGQRIDFWQPGVAVSVHDFPTAKRAPATAAASDMATYAASSAPPPAPIAARDATAPSVDPIAYVEAHFIDSEDAPILPGRVALIRDGAFVGEGRLGFVAPGDGVDLGFGGDDKVRVDRAPTDRKENEPTWFTQTKIETREFLTSVKNLHAFPVKVEVIDRLPVSENAAIVVELSPATTPPTDEQVGDKRGVMSWTLDLKPGEAKDVRFAYRMKWPADREVVLGDAAAPNAPR